MQAEHPGSHHPFFPEDPTQKDRLVRHLMHEAEVERRPHRREPLPEDTQAGCLMEFLQKKAEEYEYTKAERLLRACRNAIFHYIDSRARFVDAVDAFNKFPDQKDARTEADRARRSAHIALVDAIRIAVRNVIQHAGIELPADFRSFVGEGEDPGVRERVAKLANDYAFACLDHEL